MADLAPPVRRGDFFYSSMLYADVGNGNHHPRATVSQIATLLRPEPRAQQSATSAKDKFWHWYSPASTLWTAVDQQQEYGEGETFGCHQPVQTRGSGVDLEYGGGAEEGVGEGDCEVEEGRERGH